MGAPEFVLRLRERIGQELLWLPGATGVVLDEDRVLLVERADNGWWTLPGGIIDPGEEPADAAVREVWEETGVEVVAERLVSVQVQDPYTYANGDQAQFLDLTFRCRPVGGAARVNDEESTAVGWFDLDDLPELPSSHLHALRQASLDGKEAWFASSSSDVW